jgi:hypothetical protein
MGDLPDYTKYVTPPSAAQLKIELPTVSVNIQPVIAQYRMFGITEENAENALTTEYLKQGCLLPTYVIVSDPTGAIVSYEGGYACRALIYKAGSGEVALAKLILDVFKSLQNADGSYYQQYYPTRGITGLFPGYARAGEPYSTITVDSGAAMLAWAMADYDAKIGGGSTVYKTSVQLAMAYLRECQVRHTAANPGSYLLANQRWDYGLSTEKWNTDAFAADTAECVLAALAALDTYGTGLLDSNGYAVKTFANNMYKSLATISFRGDPAPGSLDDAYFWTEHPVGSVPWLMPANIVPIGISYAQALCSWAVYAWAKSAHLIGGTPDYSYICERALNWANALLNGKWGGYYYHPIGSGYGKGIAGDSVGLYDEFPAFTSLMSIAMQTVNSSLYAHKISRCTSFIRRASFTGGRVANRVKIDGVIDLGEATVQGDGMHFRALNTVQGLLAGA